MKLQLYRSLSLISTFVASTIPPFTKISHSPSSTKDTITHTYSNTLWKSHQLFNNYRSISWIYYYWLCCSTRLVSMFFLLPWKEKCSSCIRPLNTTLIPWHNWTIAFGFTPISLNRNQPFMLWSQVIFLCWYVVIAFTNCMICWAWKKKVIFILY